MNRESTFRRLVKEGDYIRSGFYRNNKENGLVILADNDEICESYYKNGELHGPGRSIVSDGTIFVAEYVNG